MTPFPKSYILCKIGAIDCLFITLTSSSQTVMFGITLCSYLYYYKISFRIKCLVTICSGFHGIVDSKQEFSMEGNCDLPPPLAGDNT